MVLFLLLVGSVVVGFVELLLLLLLLVLVLALLVGLKRFVLDLDRFEERLEAEEGFEMDWYGVKPFVLRELFDPVRPLEDPTPTE